MGRTITSATLEAQSSSFRTPFFVLKPGFEGDFAVQDIKDIEVVKEGNKEVVGHRIIGSNKNGKSSIHGALIANSFIVDTKTFNKIKELDTIKDTAFCWKFDEVSAIAAHTFEEVYEKDDDGNYKDFEYPEKLKILGAAIFPAQEDDEEPMVPLFMYPGYKLLRNHHRKVMGDKNARLGYWDAVSYLDAKEPIAGLKDGFKFEVSDEIRKNPKKWVFRLIIKDPRK